MLSSTIANIDSDSIADLQLPVVNKPRFAVNIASMQPLFVKQQ